MDEESKMLLIQLSAVMTSSIATSQVVREAWHHLYVRERDHLIFAVTYRHAGLLDKREDVIFPKY